MSLQIQPGLVWAWRAPGRLQIGLDPRLGVILDGLTPADERLLAALVEGADLTRVRVLAERVGIGAARMAELLGTLRGSGVLVERHTPAAQLRALGPVARGGRLPLRPLARTLALTYPGGDGWDVLVSRRSRVVAVAGAGATGLRIAFGLATAGVGAVVLADDARVGRADVHSGGYRTEHVGRRREAAGAELLAAAVPTLRTGARAGGRPDLVVAIGFGALDASRYDELVREGVAHLAVLLRERDAVVGPLVRPGRTCCLRCLDLHRRDRDPEWPRVVPQAAARRTDGEDVVLSALAAALAVAQALTQLDLRLDPSSLGTTLEIGLPDGSTALRAWPAHHGCGCSALPASAAPGRDAGASAGGAARTMSE